MSTVAIVSDKQLGDITLLEPTVRWLSAQSDCTCAMFVKPVFRPLIDLMPYACWGPEMIGKLDTVWTTSWSTRAAFQTLRIRAKKNILLANKTRHLHWWYRFIFQDIRINQPGAEYWGKYFWRMVGGKPVQAFTPARLNQPPLDWAYPNLPAQPFSLINPTAAWENKFWSVPQWRELIALLRKRTAMPIMLTGGGTPVEVRHCEEIANGLDVINLAGRTSLKQYLFILSRASVVLCVDGAASHLSHAFDVPTLTLFGPTSDEKWHYGSPRKIALASRHFTGQGFGPTSGIPSSAVMEAAYQLLGTTFE